MQVKIQDNKLVISQDYLEATYQMIIDIDGMDCEHLEKTLYAARKAIYDKIIVKNQKITVTNARETLE